MKFSRAFTIIELIFVIVVLGILATVALPKFGKTREMADIAKGRGDIVTIRTAIANDRQSKVIRGCTAFIQNGVGTYTCSGVVYKHMDNGGLFGGVLMNPMPSGSTSGNWDNNGANGNGSYRYWVGTTSTQFDYNATSGNFGCTAGIGDCNALVD